MKCPVCARELSFAQFTHPSHTCEVEVLHTYIVGPGVDVSSERKERYVKEAEMVCRHIIESIRNSDLQHAASCLVSALIFQRLQGCDDEKKEQSRMAQWN